MNIKLKALLIAIAYVSAPFLFLFLAFAYPLIILFAAIALIVWLVYNRVLYDLTKDHRKKNGYTIKEFNKEFGEPK